jgi:hypothetical protein
VRQAASALQAAVLPASRLPVQVPAAGGANPTMDVPGQVPPFPVILCGDESQSFMFCYVSMNRALFELNKLTLLRRWR